MHTSKSDIFSKAISISLIQVAFNFIFSPHFQLDFDMSIIKL